MSSIHAIERELEKKASKKRAQTNAWFFKTGKGEYGYGDQFIGVRVPDLRIIAKKYRDIPLDEMLMLLKNPIHEYRLIAVLLMTYAYERADEAMQKKLYTAYLDHTQWINNWDIVDSSAHKIVGPYLQERSRKKLYQFARSQSLWERRIAIIATLHYIRQKDFDDTLAIAELLLRDDHDLIHKAVGWMLREVGKKDEAVLKKFLDAHARTMPRTMLRYAIERLPEKERKEYTTV